MSPTPGPPYATIVPEHASVRAGEPVQLQCLAHGTHPLTFQWSRVGNSLPQRTTTRNQLLHLEPTGPEDSGRYRCQVTNKVGSAEAFAQVQVQGKWPELSVGRGVSFPPGSLVTQSWALGDPHLQEPHCLTENATPLPVV